MAPETDVAGVVLVEGESDKAAVAALARRYGRDLASEGIAVISMGGITNVGHHLAMYRHLALEGSLRGLCDRAEVPHVHQAIERAGLAPDGIGDLALLGFHVCDRDLEEELIRAVGVAGAEAFAEREGELRSFRTFQRQPDQRGVPTVQQLHRFIGTKSGRKLRYAAGLVDAAPLDDVPAPLAALLSQL